MASREEREKKRARAKRTQAPAKQIQASDSKPDQMREFPENYWKDTPFGQIRKDVEAITGQRTHFADIDQIHKRRIGH